MQQLLQQLLQHLLQVMLQLLLQLLVQQLLQQLLQRNAATVVARDAATVATISRVARPCRLVLLGDGVLGVQPSVVDVGSRGRVSQGKNRPQAGDEGVLCKTVSSDRRPRGADTRTSVEERPQEVQHCPYH